MTDTERPRADDPGADEDVPTDREIDRGHAGDQQRDAQTATDVEPATSAP